MSSTPGGWRRREDPMLAKDDVLNALREAMEPLPWVNAMWLGGSTAMGAEDALSGSFAELRDELPLAVEWLETQLAALDVAEPPI